jgi:uncharacterized RDD family membrane protein YckC
MDSNPYAPPVADVNVPVAAPADDSVVLAGRGARLGATLIDLVLLGAAGLPVMIGVVMFALVKGGRLKAASTSVATVAAIGGILGMIGFLIFQAYRLATRGQTLGKKWVGIRVVRLDGAPANFSSAVLLRAVVPNVLARIPYLGWIFALVDVLFIFRDDRRCLHDLMASTKVIDVDQ